MPIDKYFTSGYKSDTRVQSRNIAAAKMKRGWPVEAQFQRSEETVKLWMREEGKEGWFHVRNLAPAVALDEKEAWTGSNQGWEFKLTMKKKREQPVPKKFGPKSKTGY